MKLKSIVVIIAIAILPSLSVNAQCKTLVKQALTTISPYTHNGQLNNAILPEGGVADFKLACYKGLNYRINVVADAVLGKVAYRVLDEDNHEVYSNKDAASNVWDFAVSSSQDLTVEVSVPLADNSKKGCVALLVGFQPAKKAGGLR